MPQETMLSPPFNALLEADIDEATGDALLQFKGNDNRRYRVQIVREIISNVIVTLTDLAQRTHKAGLLSTGQQVDFQPFVLLGLQASMDQQGRPGLVLRLDGGLELAMLLPAEALPDIRAEISKLEELIKPKPPGAHQH